jgi:hypothetical protein
MYTAVLNVYYICEHYIAMMLLCTVIVYVIITLLCLRMLLFGVIVYAWYSGCM